MKHGDLPITTPSIFYWGSIGLESWKVTKFEGCKVGDFVEIGKLQDWNIVENPSIDLGPFDSNRPAKTGFPYIIHHSGHFKKAIPS